LEGGAAAVNEAGRMRMQTWRLAQTLASGDTERLQAHLARFDRTLALLRSGDPTRPLFVPRDAESQRNLANVERGWAALRERWLAQPPPPATETARQAETYVGHVDAFVTA